MNNSVKIKCLVIDDEEPAIAVLSHFISQVPYLEYKGGYTSPVKGLHAAQNDDVDILFLDVQMPEVSGLDLIKNIRSECQIILTTAYSQYAIDGFDCDVTDYLLKPIPIARFLKAVEKAKNQFFSREKELANSNTIRDDYILVKADAKGKYFKVDYKDIDYIEGMKNYVAIVCGDKKIISLLNIKDLEQRLPAQQFVRTHKSFIVSIAKISSITGNQIRFKNAALRNILIGDTYKDAFFEVMKGAIIK